VITGSSEPLVPASSDFDLGSDLLSTLALLVSVVALETGCAPNVIAGVEITSPGFGVTAGVSKSDARGGLRRWFTVGVVTAPIADCATLEFKIPAQHDSAKTSCNNLPCE
jgi:hypothetical protein